tara:strand:+ start:742 stop:1515 length:774 start_codon:yes stop_codon:yes gene_type:complete
MTENKEEINAAEAAFADELRALLAQGDLDPRLQEAIVALSNTNNTTLIDPILDNPRDPLLDNNTLGQYRPVQSAEYKNDPAHARHSARTTDHMRASFQRPWPDDVVLNNQSTRYDYLPEEAAQPGDIIAQRDPATAGHEGLHRLQGNRALQTETGVPRIDEIIAQQLEGNSPYQQSWVEAFSPDTGSRTEQEYGAYALADGTYGPSRDFRADDSSVRETLMDQVTMLLGLNNDARALQKLYPEGEVPPLPRYGSPAP